MALATCELMWLKQMLQILRFWGSCTNDTCMWQTGSPPYFLKSNLLRGPNIERDHHIIEEKILSRHIITGFVNSNDQLADVITKLLKGPQISYICDKLGAYDL